jgi:hypothetical protein
MRTRRVLSTGFVVILALASLPASAPYMPIDEVKPGMVGIGKTVFEGTRIDEFKVQVLGVLRNAAGPQRTMVLARLEGGPLAGAGVIAGMSGSPVYIDGRLVGAVAYSVGSFAKEPLAGITPIAEMIEAVDTPGGRLVRPPDVSAGLVSRDAVMGVLRRALPRLRPFADRPDDVRWLSGLSGTLADGGLGMQLRPIETPLVLSGFSDDIRGEIAEAFRPGGFLPVTGMDSNRPDRAATSRQPRAPLQPGDAVGVELITGDFSFAATGTVTEVAGGRVYAFGHPFYNLGPTRFPMTRAYVHALLPSLLTSSKITTTGEVIGTFLQDRATALGGTLDEGPSLIPVSVVMEGARTPRRAFKLGVVRDQLLTPLLAYAVVANIVVSHERSLGAATFTVKGSATVRGHDTIVFDDVFVGDSAATDAAASIAAPLLSLLGNEFEEVEIGSLDLQITPSERQQSTTIERAWIDTDRPRAGKTTALRILLRNYRGDEETRTVPIEIPARATGTLTLLVSDASHLTQWEQREMRPPKPWTVDQVLREINRTRRGNRLYVRLVGGVPGALVNGEQFPALPPSVLAVYEADRNSGSFSPLRNALLGEWEIATGVAVLGSRQLTFSVDPER